MNPEPSNGNDILSLDQVAEILHVKRSTVQTLIKKGKLKASAISTRLVLVYRRDIDMLLEHSTVLATNGSNGATEPAES
jgi:excisionase family DNA binding protein